jgi:predicted lipid-binding transport protein (Tim44 family)
MQESIDISTIIFAVLAIFVLYKLKSVLGTRTGEERPPQDPFSRRRDDAGKAAAPGGSAQSNVIPLPGAANSNFGRSTPPVGEERWGKLADPDAFAGLDAIAAAAPGFDGAPFVDGARSAYEMIVTSFARGDRDTLRSLLASDVFDSFSSAIGAREAQGETVETTFVSIDRTTIADAHLREGVAQVTVRFASKIITVTRDRAGAIVEGGVDKIMDVIDVWTFARQTAARDPNWKLVATEAAH